MNTQFDNDGSYRQVREDSADTAEHETNFSTYTVSEPGPADKKNNSAKKGKIRIAALFLAVALVFGFSGGAIAGLYLSSSNTTAEEAATETSDASTETAATDTTTDTTDSTSDSSTKSVMALASNTEDAEELTASEVYEKCVNSVVSITSSSTTTNVFGQASDTASSGSGFIVSSDGYIVTNYHVVEDADTLTVTLTSGDSYEAELIGCDEDGDIALLKIEATGLTAVSIGDSDDIVVGQQVVAIGNPLGELTNTLTVGYVSALDREISVDDSTSINMFQTDCAINPGNSGGPLFDMYGNVIGITTAKYSSDDVEGIGFAIPINDVADIINDLLEYGYVTGKPYLGVTLQDLSEDVTQYYNLSGIYVYSVTEDSPADEAGLEAGDIITMLDDTEVTATSELTSALNDYSAGDIVSLTVYRDGETMVLSVTLGDKSEAEQEAEAEEEAASEDQPSTGSNEYPEGYEDFYNYYFGQQG